MNYVAYQLTGPLHGLLLGDRWGSAYVADGDDMIGGFNAHRLELESHIRSGDYFTTLATKLDDFNTRLERGGTLDRSEIDRIVNDLFYIESNYRLAPKA